jgi:putative flippase GtrA
MLQKQILKFIAVGVVNTLFGYGIYAFFIFLGLHYMYAVLFATIAGVLFNFKTIGRYVFDSSDSSLLLKFIMVYAVVYGMNIGLIRFFTLWDIDYYTAGFLAVVPCAAISFILNKRFVFRTKVMQ